MEKDIEKIIEVAEGEVGYLEKKTNKDLDSKAANAGRGNFTKYSRDLVKMIGAPYAQAVYWCDMFVDWCFIKAFGAEKAKRLLGGWSAYTPTSALLFRQMNRFDKTPEVGAVIFFTNGVRICHTGIVVSVDAKTITTIEGNATTAKGDGVGLFRYLKTDSRIAGYGHPDYGVEIPDELTKTVACDGTARTAYTPRTWAGKAFPQCGFSVTKGDRLGICSKHKSAAGVLWYYIKHYKTGKRGFIPAKGVTL